MDGYKGCELLNTTKRCHSTDGVNRKKKNVPVDMTDRELEGGGVVRWGSNAIDNCYVVIGFDFTI